MTEQDDLFGQKKHQQGEHDEGFVASVDDVAGGGSAGGEVRLAETPAPAKSSKPLLLLLLLVILIGGYWLISGPTASVPDSTPASPSMTNKLPIPARQIAEVPIQPQSSEPPQPAVVENTPVVTPLAAPVPAPVVGAKTSGSAVVVPAESAPVTLYSVQVGPFLSKPELAKATTQLQALGFAPRETQGRGLVTMTRLLEGLYPEAEARQRLTQLIKKVGDAFILPTGDKWALYVGSFSDSERAVSSAAQLAKNGVKVTLVTSDLEMGGNLLLVVQGDQAVARQAADLINSSGLKPQLVPK